MPGPVFLEGETVSLRPVEREDIEFLHRVMNDRRVWRPALDIDPMNAEQGEEFFETVITNGDGVHCLACDGEEPLGVVTLAFSQYGPDETSRARSAELAYWFAPEHHGRGYGSDAAARMVRYAFEDRNLRRLSARLGSFNDASRGLLESLGFEREGRLREAAWYRGEYHDMLVYGLLRKDWDASESE
ncbi:GNAT family N-acetyltransferase [Halorussus salilacus]|uniref:GNAT family N-acetyltransferase n=1 Tax=Halorussus salilacus TaxID=2953750 RepID=UPI0020A004A7|nr:GNAT family protein [Halorussus salilacus]USZ68390.1 GNAT family N-acetyltransferase [Halorussus salilacus]